MPCDEELLEDPGRVQWATARLHFTMRDTLNLLHRELSDAPFDETPGGVKKTLRKLAASADATRIVEWTEGIGGEAIDVRNAVADAATITAEDGRQALITTGKHGVSRLDRDALRETTALLIQAARNLTTARDYKPSAAMGHAKVGKKSPNAGATVTVLTPETKSVDAAKSTTRFKLLFYFSGG